MTECRMTPRITPGMFCSETEQGELCRQSYLRLQKKGVEVDLKLIMVNNTLWV